jgi:hypothetical protein
MKTTPASEQVDILPRRWPKPRPQLIIQVEVARFASVAYPELGVWHSLKTTHAD